LRAVAALAAGRDREDVAAVFGVSLQAVDRWWAKWQAGGREATLVMQPPTQIPRCHPPAIRPGRSPSTPRPFGGQPGGAGCMGAWTRAAAVSVPYEHADRPGRG
jgi:hypothetical protein